MKIRVLALDFDNTIAVHDRLDPNVATALYEARGGSILRVLVTGRILSDLMPLLPSHDLFDAIVAENGAVLQLAHDPHPIALSSGPDSALVAELSKRAIAHRCGTCIVEASATLSHDVLTVVIAGKVVMEVRVMYTMDKPAILAKAHEYGRKVAASLIEPPPV